MQIVLIDITFVFFAVVTVSVLCERLRRIAEKESRGK